MDCSSSGRAERWRRLTDIEGWRRSRHLSGTGADQVSRRTCAAHQCQRIHHDGFAGPGFAGEHGEPAGEIQLERVDDGQVTGSCRWVSMA